MVGWLPSSQELAGFLNLKYQFVMLTWPKPASVCYHPRLASPDLASHSFDYFMKGNCRHQHGHQSDLDRLGWTNHCKVLSVAPKERCTSIKDGKSLEKGANSFISTRARVLWVKTVVARSHQVGRKVRSRSSVPPPSRALCTQPTQVARCKDERKEVQTPKLSLYVQESGLYDV